MGVTGSTQRLRPMVNPDGKVGLKISRRLIERLDGEQPSTSASATPSAPEPERASRPEPRRDPAPPDASARHARSGAPFPPAADANLARLQNLRTFAAMGAVGDAQAVDEHRPMFPGLDHALARSLRVGELLLKNEEAELQMTRERASATQARHHLVHVKAAPCVAEREACRVCYETNAEDTLRCGHEVAAYDACARAARDAVAREGRFRASAES